MATRYIALTSGINAKSEDHLLKVLDHAMKDDAIDRLTLYISSLGGDLYRAHGMHHIIQMFPKPTTTHGFGVVGSAAITLLLGGQTRFAASDTSFAFHGIGTSHINGALDADRLRLILNNIEIDKRGIQDLWMQYLTISDEEINALFGLDVWKDTDFALKHNFIQAVAPITLPKETIFVHHPT